MVQSFGTVKVTIDDEKLRDRVRVIIREETVPCPQCGYEPSEEGEN